jgi:hypothetical protein
MKTPVRLSVLALVASFALVGCGGADKGVSGQSPTKLLATAKKDLASEKFVRLKGNGTDKDNSTLGVDMGFSGATVSGSISINGLSIQLLRADGKSYFKASDDFYRSAAGASADQVIALINGRWVTVEASDPNFGELASFTSKKEFFGQLLDPDSKVTKGKEKKVNGVDCVSLKDASGTLYFDKSDGKPIQLVSKGKGQINFTYGKFAKATAPPADQIVDPSELTQ